MQLVFCVACLSMAGWTWMRYSYAWDVEAARLGHDLAVDRLLWEGRYVRLRGKALGSAPLGQVHKGKAAITAMHSHASLSMSVSRCALVENGPAVLWLWTGRDLPASGDVLVVTGRVLGPEHKYRILADMPDSMGLPGCPLVLAEASRFTGASIAGLVVGAMGVFIFGLYLRAWLRERKALASEPQRDIIA
jgi:hypothetical protein